MRKVAGLAAASLLLAVAPAAARTVTLAITKDGFVPRAVAIATGDSVTLANQDAVAHQVVLKPATGFTCSPGGLVIQPAQGVTCTFHTATKYSVSDAGRRKAAFKASITVSASTAGAVALKAARPIVTYGASETFSGTIAAGMANQKVDLLARECAASNFKIVASTTTTTGGAYTVTTRPLKETAYTARFKSSTSAESAVRVRPAVSLRRVAPRRFAVRVLAADSFVGKVAVLQRYSAARRAWIRVRLVPLARTSPSAAPTVATVASFRARVRAGLRVRALVTAVQASPCYTAGASRPIRS